MNVQVMQDSTKTRNASASASEIARSLGKDFASRAGEYDATDSFAAENFREIKAAGLLSIGVPAELGGGDASYRDLCEMLRETARHCSGTALALAMHTHPLAASVWRWRKGDKAPVEGLLKRVATEKLMLLSTGGNDWLSGSGTAEKTEGGYFFSGHKRFVSGAEAGDILMTMARDGDTVLHAERAPCLLDAHARHARQRLAGCRLGEGLRTRGNRRRAAAIGCLAPLLPSCLADRLAADLQRLSRCR